MAYTAGSLHLMAGAVGDLCYKYDAGSDTMATVIADGYFNNTDDDLNLTADDRILCDCTDGNMWLKVSSTTSGYVVTQFAGGDLPIQTFATGTAAPIFKMEYGHYEVGTSIAVATRGVLPVPYAGAEMIIVKVDSGSALISFDAGACASDISVGGSGNEGGGTGVTYDSVGNRRIVLQTEMDMVHLKGVSSTRWRIYGANVNASLVAPAGGSVFIQGT